MTPLSPRLAQVVAALPLESHLRVLEIGCGPGAAARTVAAHLTTGHILAIDRSATAINQLRARSTEEIASGRLSARQAAIEEFTLLRGEEPFDLVFAIRIGALDGRHPKPNRRLSNASQQQLTETLDSSSTADNHSASYPSQGLPDPSPLHGRADEPAGHEFPYDHPNLAPLSGHVMSREAGRVSSFYHLCFVVQDLDRATADLTSTLGVAWSRVRDGRLGPWDYRIVFSADGPPFFEVIEGPPGSPWDATAGSRFDHLGYWSEDIPVDKQRLADRVAPLEFDSCPYDRSLHLPPTRQPRHPPRTRRSSRATQLPDHLEARRCAHGPDRPQRRFHRDRAGLVNAPRADAEQCRALLIDFLAAIDQGRATAALELFTPDAVFDARPEWGRDQLSSADRRG